MLNRKVSVIVPIYNSELYLSSCIESIINQTYEKLEIILIDDGSEDESLKICHEYELRDKRIRVFHQKNSGVSAARNLGINMSQGEYITFVDSDDELLLNGISLLVHDIESFNSDIAMASKLHVSEDNEDKNILFDDTDKDVCVFSGTDSLKMSLDFDRRMTACHGKLFKKQFIEGVYFEEGRKINEDFYFIFLCSLKQPLITHRDNIVYKYYYRNNSSSRTLFSEKYFDMLYFADLKKQKIEQLYPDLIDKAICMEVSTHLFMLNMLCKTTDPKYREAEKKSIKVVIDNYKKYVSKNKFEKKLSWIVAHGMYPIYKKFIQMKYFAKLRRK